MDFPHGTMLTVRQNVETTDDLGDTIIVPTDHAWGPCAVAPRYASESTSADSPRVVVGNEIYGPQPPVSLTAADEILIGNEVWQIDGRPEDFTGAGANPFTGWEPGVVVPIKRASGS